jgi:hypothetical protein
LSTLNRLAPPTCKSISRDAVALVVSVTFSLNPVKVTAALFQVCVRLATGALAVIVVPERVVDPNRPPAIC